MLVFNVKSGLHSDVVSVKFSSGSAVQRCCFLLNVAQIFTLKWAAVGVFVPSHPPLFSLDLGHSVGVAAFNVCVIQNLNLDIKLIFKKR